MGNAQEGAAIATASAPIISAIATVAIAAAAAGRRRAEALPMGVTDAADLTWDQADVADSVSRRLMQGENGPEMRRLDAADWALNDAEIAHKLGKQVHDYYLQNPWHDQSPFSAQGLAHALVKNKGDLEKVQHQMTTDDAIDQKVVDMMTRLWVHEQMPTHEDLEMLKGMAKKWVPKKTSKQLWDDNESHSFLDTLFKLDEPDCVRKNGRHRRHGKSEAVFCAADIRECPDGKVVSRDSSNGCKFEKCSFCFEDARICGNGKTVSRDPFNGCEFEPCHDEDLFVCSADTRKCPDGNVVSRDENNGCKFGKCSFCFDDARICDNGNTVTRDPSNGCEFDPCEVASSISLFDDLN